MAEVSVTIAGRTYRMACGDGEEEHLQGLAATLDGKIAALRRDFGEIGDQRITVMAALTFADELLEAGRRVAALQADVDRLRQDQSGSEIRAEGVADAVAAALDQAAGRIERLVQGLNAAQRE